VKGATSGLVPIPRNPLGAAVVAVAWIVSAARIDVLRDTASSWQIPPAVPVMRGLRWMMDAGTKAPLNVKVAREILRTNPRIGQIDALLLDVFIANKVYQTI